MTTRPSSTPVHDTPPEPPRFAWRPCPRHAVLVLSVIETPDSAPWCIGDGDAIAGHWVEAGGEEPEVAA